MNRVHHLYELIAHENQAVLLTSMPNIRYYLGDLAIKEAFLLITKSVIYLLSPESTEIKGVLCISTDDPILTLKRCVTEQAADTLSVEPSSVTCRLFEKLRAGFHCDIVPDNDLEAKIYARRCIKRKDEIDKIRQAQEITDDVFTESLNFIKAGMTDREMQLIVGLLFHRMGSQMLSFNHVFGCGEDTALPHVRPSGRIAQEGDFVMMDIGAQVDGYGSDMTRMVGIGSVNEEKQQVYAIVLKAQTAAIAAIACGKRCMDIDAAARDVIERAGYGAYFLHGLGHPIGLGGWEGPRFNQWEKTPVTPALVMTAEPGIYLPGKFGVRIEDMVLIGEDRIENLTHSTKELICV